MQIDVKRVVLSYMVMVSKFLCFWAICQEDRHGRADAVWYQRTEGQFSPRSSERPIARLASNSPFGFRESSEPPPEGRLPPHLVRRRSTDATMARDLREPERVRRSFPRRTSTGTATWLYLTLLDFADGVFCLQMSSVLIVNFACPVADSFGAPGIESTGAAHEFTKCIASALSLCNTFKCGQRSSNLVEF